MPHLWLDLATARVARFGFFTEFREMRSKRRTTRIPNDVKAERRGMPDGAKCRTARNAEERRMPNSARREMPNGVNAEGRKM